MSCKKNFPSKAGMANSVVKGTKQIIQVSQPPRSKHQQLGMDPTGVGITLSSPGLVRKQMGSHRQQTPRKVHCTLERSDNCLKNHFYSKLRKGLRKINKKIHKYLKRDYKDIKTSTLYKIIETM